MRSGRRDPAAGLAALGAGALVCAALPPWGWWPLAIVGLALFDRLLVLRPARSRAVRGALFALGWLAPGMGWMWQLSVAGYVVATLVFAGYLALVAVVVPPEPSARRWVALVAAVTLSEGVRFAFPFGGVPLASLPMGQVGSPLAWAAPLGGALLLTALTVSVGCGVSALVRRRPALGPGVALVVVPLMVAALGPVVASASTARGDAVTVAAVQGGGPQGTRAATSDERVVFERHLAATTTVTPGVDMVVWPENVVDVDTALFAGSAQAAAIAVEAERIGAPILVGVTEDTPDGRSFLNAQDVVAPGGTVVDRYVKVRRVPFGEYLPLRGLIEAVQPSAGRLVPRDAIGGDGPALLDVPGVGEVAVAISWEVFFGGRARDGVGHGGELLVNPTNGSSYTGTIVQSQQVASSRLRARETGRSVVQVAPTGFTAIVDSDGDVEQRTSVSEARVLIAEVDRITGETPYVRLGDRPWYVAAVAVLGGAWLAPGIASRVRRRPAASPARR